MPLGAVAVPGRRVPASSGPNLPGPRTGAAAAPRVQHRCAVRGVPVLAASPARGWQPFQGGGGRAGRGTHGAASCCLRRSSAHACMAALQRG